MTTRDDGDDGSGVPEEELSGGGTTVVVRIGDTVRRPARPWTGATAALLQALHREGLTGVPRWLGLDEQGRETLDHLPGEVGNYPLSAAVRSETALLSGARLLRRYHDATAGLLGELTGGWQQAPLEPAEVICHGDFAPYNCVFADDGTATGIIDFDTARPGPRSWDLAYALYRFAPLTAPTNHDGFGDPDTRIDRAVRFLEAYGCSAELAGQAFTMVPLRLSALVTFMYEAAGAGDPNFARHIEEGHADLYRADVRHAEEHLGEWLARVNGWREPRTGR